jgi:hypothetical protein
MYTEELLLTAAFSSVFFYVNICVVLSINMSKGDHLAQVADRNARNSSDLAGM